jgi:uncharacterized protein YcaQ
MMMKETRLISHTVARRLAIVAQGLAGLRPRADTEGIMDVIGRLGCLQLDPITIVARSHLLVLWSRLGPYDQGLLDLLLWQERRLFEYWAHAASIVLTQDYPLHQMRMRSYGKGFDAWSQQVSAWMQQNETLRISILSALQQRGPLRSRDFEDPVQVAWRSSGWTDGRTVGRMLDFLWAQGHILVSKRVGAHKWWDLFPSLGFQRGNSKSHWPFLLSKNITRCSFWHLHRSSLHRLSTVLLSTLAQKSGEKAFPCQKWELETQ